MYGIEGAFAVDSDVNLNLHPVALYYILEHHTAQCLSATHGRERACAHFSVDSDVNLNLHYNLIESQVSNQGAMELYAVPLLCNQMHWLCIIAYCIAFGILHTCILQTVCCLLIMHTAVHFYALTLCAECN